MADSTKTGSDEFGETLRRARERLGMSRRDLAEAAGLSYPYISQLETGYRMPSSPAMRSLATALELSVDSLFDAVPPSPGRDTVAAKAPAPQDVRARSTARAIRSAAASMPIPRPPAASAPAAPGAAGGAVGAGWIANRTWSPHDRAGGADALSAGSPAPLDRDRTVEQATSLLTALPSDDRLAALGEVQARVVQSVVDDATGPRT